MVVSVSAWKEEPGEGLDELTFVPTVVLVVELLPDKMQRICINGSKNDG